MVTKAFTFPRSHFIGFDHVWNEIERLSEVADNKLYPPHNVVKHDEKHFSVELAVAGYRRKDLNVELRDGILTITAQGRETLDESEVIRDYLHKGISTKKFIRNFRLSEHVVVDGADLVDGILVIHLRVELPEEKRPRIIEIGSNPEPQLLTED